MKQKLLSNYRLAGIIFLISALASCTNSKTVDDGSYFQDFDNLKRWQPDAQVTNEMSHSGSYAAYTDSAHEFSQTFIMEYDFAKSKQYKTMAVSVWCLKTTDNPNAALVVSVEGPEKQLRQTSLDLSKSISEKNQWQHVSTFMDLPEEAPEHAKVKVYVWSPGKKKVFLDDVLIEFGK